MSGVRPLSCPTRLLSWRVLAVLVATYIPLRGTQIHAFLADYRLLAVSIRPTKKAPENRKFKGFIGEEG
jgi:hypothetical protein